MKKKVRIQRARRTLHLDTRVTQKESDIIKRKAEECGDAYTIKSIKAEHEEFVKEEKKLLSEHREALKTSMSESVAEKKQVYENHKIEMERTKEYGEGVWFSKRAWDWIFGFMIVSGFWFVASITAVIVLWINRT